MMDFIKSSLGQLATRVVFARTFQWGAYAAALAVLFTLASKLVTPGFSAGGGSAFGGHHSSFIPYLFIIIGLLIGAIMGLFNRPTLLQTAIFLDEKLGGKNYLATLVECSAKPRPNDVEAMLNQPPQNDIIPAAEHLRIPYNYANFVIFLALLMGLMIIQQTPISAINSGEIRNPQSVIRNSNAQISNIKTQVKTLQETAGDASTKLLAKIEQLVREMEQGTAAPSLVLEKLNEFSRTAQGLPADDKDTARIRALLDKLQEYYKMSNKAQNTGFTRATESAQTRSDGAIGSQTIDNNQLNQLNPVEAGQVPLTEVTPAYLKKLGEEALRKPYWPAEYNEVIEKYFTTTDEHR